MLIQKGTGIRLSGKISKANSYTYIQKYLKTQNNIKRIQTNENLKQYICSRKKLLRYKQKQILTIFYSKNLTRKYDYEL